MAASRARLWVRRAGGLVGGVLLCPGSPPGVWRALKIRDVRYWVEPAAAAGCARDLFYLPKV